MNSRLTKRQQGLAVAGSGAAVVTIALLALAGSEGRSQPNPAPARFVPSEQQLKSFAVQTVTVHAFRTEIVTDGYVAAGGGGKFGNSLPVLPSQASDTVQAENDLAAAQVQYRNAAAAEDRQHKLYQAQGAALKDWQQSQADLATAASALASARNRLRLQGKSDVGSGGAFTVGDNKSVWLVANVREADAGLVHVGDQLAATPSAASTVVSGRISFVSSVIDPSTHRLVVGARVPNPDGMLKPNMLAAMTITGSAARNAPAVPRNAVIYDGDQARVWVIGPGNHPLPRNVTLGRSSGKLVEVTSGLRPGERIATAGGLFIDQAMTSD